jgi:thioredoxin-like negative regulator of GroEL
VIAYSRAQKTDRFHSAQPENFLRRFIDKLIERHSADSKTTEGAQQSD